MKAPWPFGHLGLKTLSIGIALLLWLFVSGDETVERGLRVPLEFQQFPAGVEMMGEAPSLIDVRVRGGSSTLSRLGAGDIVAQLDLKAARVGRRLYQITPEQVRVPFGVQVVQVTPPTIVLAFEISATKQVPVVPELDGEPAAGFVIGTTQVDPPTVEVVGPESAIARVVQATTEPVPVAGARNAVKDTVTIGLLDPSLRLKTPRLAQVTVDVIPGPVERAFRERPVHLVNLGSNLVARATPHAVEVVVRGSREGVGEMEMDEVVASVDLAGLGVGTYTLPVHVESPVHAGIARVLPATLQVTINSGKN
jgi:YbbR domain-containing protein